VIVILGGIAFLALPLVAYDDLAGRSTLQARYFTRLAQDASFHLESGRNPDIRFPAGGPFDERLGYAALPVFLERLEARGCTVVEQARWSPRLAGLSAWGIFPPYRESSQAGMTLRDRHGATLFTSRYPERIYWRYEDIPPVVVDSLLFIENRELLNDQHPKRNPAIEFDRLVRSTLDRGIRWFDPAHRAGGGSTLATQMEKYRHSRDGRTDSMGEKLRQMVSASVRIYQDGEDTRARRKQIVLDYLNSVPLGGRPGWGEVHGVGDGLRAWYGRDLAAASALLVNTAPGEPALAAKAAAYKEFLSLLVGQRRPSDLLGANLIPLDKLTNRYLHLLAAAGIIGVPLRDAAIASPLAARAPMALSATAASDKAVDAVRTHLADALGVPQRYDLDRLDLAVNTTIDGTTQAAVTAALRRLSDPAAARAAGLMGEQLLARGDPAKVVYSVTLYEIRDATIRPLVQADNYGQPFDVNEGLKLDLGSSAKLRTLVTYLEFIAALHQRYAGLDAAALRSISVNPQDVLSRWAIDYLARNPSRELLPMLQDALERRYSADSGEQFFTGGGLHTFHNFRPEDNRRVLSVREAFRESVNLVFVRLMRDIVRHQMYANGAGEILRDPNDLTDPRRERYLSRYVERESRVFVERFYRKLRGLSHTQVEAALMDRGGSGRASSARAASVIRTLAPGADLDAFREFIERWTPRTIGTNAGSVPASRIETLYAAHAPEHLSLADRAYLADRHPLELAVAAFLRERPDATLTDTLSATAQSQQDAYAWLYTPRQHAARERALRIMLEQEAFKALHQAWQRLGYPFDTLVPSYATALGSAADRPAALAQLIGIILAGGVRHPVVRVDSMRFAAGTPYETALRCAPRTSEQVMAPAVAQVLRVALVDVVERGTAGRVRGMFAGDTKVMIGGKTGTGDHRYKVFNAGGALRESRAVNRAATFVFFAGDRLFGTVTAYVPGAQSANYQFTSALPVQVLKTLEPVLRPLFTTTTPASPDGLHARAGTPVPLDEE
jgi:membrane peptidoglycan carboxypeptidase